MTLLIAAHNPCNRCGSKINWDKELRAEANDGNGTPYPLNLDGTIHTKEMCQQIQTQNFLNKGGQEPLTLPSREPKQDTLIKIQQQLHPETKKDKKQEDIERMHNENVTAMTNLTAAINKVAELLTSKINPGDQLKALSTETNPI